MSVAEGTDLTEDRLFFLGTGIVYRIVCAPKSWNGDRVAAEVTSQDPPGTSANRWVVSDPDNQDDDSPFKGGNPCPCNDDAGRVHWLLNC